MGHGWWPVPLVSHGPGVGFAEKADGTAVDIFSFGMCALEVRSRMAAVSSGCRAESLWLSLLEIAVAWGASQGVSLPFVKPHCELGIPCSHGDITAVVSRMFSTAMAHPALGAVTGLAHPFCAGLVPLSRLCSSSSFSGCDSPDKGEHRGQTLLL